VKVAGADVWKGQWVLVTLADGRFDGAAVAATFEAALGLVPDASAVGVDIPVGLPAPGRRRTADRMARDLIGPRRQSLFFAPPREVLTAGSLAEANELSRSLGGAGVSAQSFALGRHILEVEPLAAADPRVHEVHPEGSFVAANGGRHLAWPKTSWNGIALRRSVLARHGIHVPDDLGPAGRAGIADVLDAAVVAWSAHRIAAGTAERFPIGHARIGAIWR
jgi:predicted RNase H-like nuclease